MPEGGKRRNKVKGGCFVKGSKFESLKLMALRENKRGLSREANNVVQEQARR